jgi:hypothetical protein
MKIGHWKQAHSWMTRPDTMPPKERAALEAKQAKAEQDRKNKKRAEYGLKPLIDPQHFVNVSNTYDGTNYVVDGNGNITDEKTLKNKFENEVIAKTKELAEDKITTKQKPLKKPVVPVLKDKRVRKPAAVPPKTKTIKVDPYPINIDFSIPSPTYKTDPELEAAKQNIEKMIADNKAEKIKNMNSGIGYLAGGIKAYE